MKVVRLGYILSSILIIGQSFVDGSCQGDVNIVTQQDLNQIKECKTFGGNILIDGSGATELKFGGIELIEGDVTISNNDGLQRLAFPNLQGINGQLKLSNNKILSLLDLGQLYALRQFELSVHPALNQLKFGAGLTQVDKLMITDTTITRIDGFQMKSIKSIEVTNNIYLKGLSFSNMTSIGNILVSANSPSLNVDMSQIESLGEGTFRNIARIGLDSLKKVSGDLSFISNSFEELDFPQTTDISGTLTLTDNLELSKLSMHHLRHLGGAMSVTGNSKLGSVDAFSGLEQIDGTVEITGSFDEIQFPVLNDVRGGLNVQSSSQKFSCDTLGQLKKGVIKGNTFVCKSNVASPKSARAGSKSTTGGKDSSESSGTLNTVSFSIAFLTTIIATFFTP